MASNSTSDSTTSDVPISVQHVNPVVAFIIGLTIILLASILNAAGLNLTKLDHVRTSTLPAAQRRRDWLRPLWLLGMVLYILSQLIGSTLALQYMRAEYVAPLGSSSLVFNFLFARFLVGTPITRYDIYGTVTITFGVAGIVLFGSINSGLSSSTDASHLASLWGRAGWLGYFLLMSILLGIVLFLASVLDGVLVERADPVGPTTPRRVSAAVPARAGLLAGVVVRVRQLAHWASQMIEGWAAAMDDNVIAWTLGILWSCAGGGLAGGTLVFAKATVKLISGSMEENVSTASQLAHFASIVTLIFLAVTAVMQIICLNRGLKVYASTLVVPVFYGVYTGTGFLNSLIFNNETDAYAAWTLFLIFVSMLVLIGGVVLLTIKKPEPKPASSASAPRLRTPGEVALSKLERGDGEVVWQVGDVSDDEDASPDELRPEVTGAGLKAGKGLGLASADRGEEGRGLMDDGHDEDNDKD